MRQIGDSSLQEAAGMLFSLDPVPGRVVFIGVAPLDYEWAEPNGAYLSRRLSPW